MNDGHKVSCCKSFTNELAGQFQGRLAPDSTPENERAAVKLKELETNLNMIQLKLLIDNSNTILSQATSFDIPLCDCMVNFDLRECPPTVDVKKYTDVYVTPEQLRRFEETRSKENITCIYCTYYGGDSEGRVVTPGFYPHNWLSKQNGGQSSSS